MDIENLQNIQAVIQYINLFFVTIFMIYLSYRLIRLRKFAHSPLHMHQYPKTRIILAIVYILLSIGLLIYIQIVKQGKNFDFNIFIIGGGGQCFNSVVLLLQLSVLWQQLSKCQNYTRCHMIYSLYLVIISFSRAICSIILIANQVLMKNFVNMIVSLFLTVYSCLLLGQWLMNKQKLTQFQYMTIQSVKENISYNLRSQKSDNRHIYNHSTAQNHQFIIPSVTVQKGNFRIILEILVQNNILKDFLDETNTQHNQKNLNNRHLQIMSNSVYTLNQIKQIYIKSHRLPLQTKLKFTDQVNLGQFYQLLQNFLEEVFSQKIHYIPEILTLFDIPKQILNQYKKFNKIQQVYNLQDITFRTLNINSSFISVSVYKQLWVGDYYCFYMDVRTMDGKDYSIPYKRYKDFYQFNQKLQHLIQQRYKKSFNLPPLPKKQFFYWNDQVRKITQRRKKLQVYCQQICNDYQLMMQFPQSHQLIINFLQLKNTLKILPKQNKFIQFYLGLQIKKGSINKALIFNQGVTLYQFKIYRKGILQKKISKRFNDFVKLHNNLQRYMKNINIQYGFIELPEKFYYKSESNRHEKLKKYLQSLIKIPEIHKVYSVNCFFDIFGDSNNSSEQYVSSIKRQSSQKIQQQKQQTEKEKKYNNQQQEVDKDILQHSLNSSSQGMSRLIEDLGN